MRRVGWGRVVLCASPLRLAVAIIVVAGGSLAPVVAAASGAAPGSGAAGPLPPLASSGAAGVKPAVPTAQFSDRPVSARQAWASGAPPASS
jgi:hypothetical protein